MSSPNQDSQPASPQPPAAPPAPAQQEPPKPPEPSPEEVKAQENHQKVVDFLNENGLEVVSRLGITLANGEFMPIQGISTVPLVVEKPPAPAPETPPQPVQDEGSQPTNPQPGVVPPTGEATP